MAEREHIVHPLEPVFDSRSRILVLGSLPSTLSRENRFYYGNPRNRFWSVLSRILQEAEPTAIGQKKHLLLKHGIAIWDVIAECDIAGSSDASIRNVVPVDIRRITDACTVRAIYVNGGTAARYYHRYLEPITQVPAVKLPSTSPANAAYSLDALCRDWNVILRNL